MTTNPTTPSTPSFRDTEGRIWRLSVTIGRARLIKQATGVDFLHIPDGRFFLELRSNPETFGSVLWLLCEKQALAMNPPLQPAEFVDGLGGDALDDARKAITEAGINFTHAAGRGVLRTALRKMEQAEAKAMNAIEQWTEAKGDELLAGVGDAALELLESHGRESPS